MQGYVVFFESARVIDRNELERGCEKRLSLLHNRAVNNTHGSKSDITCSSLSSV